MSQALSVSYAICQVLKTGIKKGSHRRDNKMPSPSPGRGNATVLENVNWMDQLRRALRAEYGFPGAIRCSCKDSHQPRKLYSG